MSPPNWKRLLLFTFGAAASVIGYLFLLHIPILSPAGPTFGVIPVLFMALATLWLTVRFLRADGLSLTDIGLEFSARRVAQLSVGFLAGGLLVGAWVGIVTIATGAQWHLNATFRGLALVGACVFAFFNNLAEELVYRGYAFIRLAAGYSPIVAVVTTSAAFALLHLQAGVPWLSVIAGVLTSGLIFAILFARWRSLPLALGVHLATNVFQDFSGLRVSPASLLAPAYPTTDSPIPIHMALAGCAALNVVVAVALAIYPRRTKATSAA